jgi:hypothetical protein
VYDLANPDDLHELIANGVGAYSSRNAEWRYSGRDWQFGNLKLLDPQTGESRPPPEWNVYILKNGIWRIAVLMRSDNLYVCAYWSSSRPGWRELRDSEKKKLKKFRAAADLNFGGMYSDINGIRENLTDVQLSQETLGDAVRSLDIYSGDDELKQAFTVLVLMLTETQRFTSIRDCVLLGLKTGCHITDKDVAFLPYWGQLSCGSLEGWPADTRYNKLKEVMRTHNVEQEDVPGMLVVLLQARKCRSTMVNRERINPPASIRSGGP